MNKKDFLINRYIELSKKADEEDSIGNIKKARSLIQEGFSLAEQNKSKSYMEFFLGELESLKKNYKEGVFHYKKAVDYEPKNPFFLRNLGITYSFLKNEKEAIKYFDMALSIKPDDYESLYCKGVSLSELGREEEAIQYYDKALLIKPNDYNSLSFKGVSLSELGRNEEAIQHFNMALNIKPDDYYSLRSKGVALNELGREKEAIPYFDMALNIKPDDYNSLCSKGVSLSKLGKEEEAIGLFNKALKIKPDDWDSLIWKAVSLEKLGQNEEVIKVLKLLKGNLNKISDKHQIDWINFKYSLLEKKIKPSKQEEIGKSSDVLNKVINAFQDKKDDFFTSINKIESNFKKFTDTKRSIPKGFPSFLSVLRKWNSYTPILPSEKGDNKGGGYFLYHKGKGIVIDPGFNFIENFYQEGFKVADIDAVLITHAHNDHTVDLESILTLIYKHNDAIKDSVKEEMKDKDVNMEQEISKSIKKKGKKIDLFLNIGTFMKYSGWLNLKDSDEINSVTVLQPETTYQLSKEYDGITIHTIKAKHHEIIDNKYVIGFILEINDIKVGFTGDTGWDFESNGKIAQSFIKHKPRLVVAHLGSIKSKEFKYVSAKNDSERNNCFYAHHLGLLGMTKLLDTIKPELTIISEFGEELRQCRKEIVQGIGEVLKLNCLPSDIGLHIRLSDLGIYCFIDNKFVDFKKIKVYSKEGDSTISFHREEPDHAKFNIALDKKSRMRAVPLAERITDLS